MADPASTSSGSRRAGPTLSAMKAADLTTEDGYRKWTKVASDLTEATGEELAFASELLRKILLRTPVSNPKTGAFSGGHDPKRASRKIAAYLKRAADAERYAQGQVKAAWKLFEDAYLLEVAGAPKGMKMDAKKAAGGSSTRRGA